MKVILWPGKGTIYTICEATWFGRTWFSPHHSFVKLVVKLVITGSLEKKTWSRQNDVEVLRRLRQNQESWRHRNSRGARMAPSPLNGGRSTTLWLDKWDLAKEVCWQRHWLRQLPWGLPDWLVIPNGFWLFFCFFSCVSFPFKLLAGFWCFW